MLRPEAFDEGEMAAGIPQYHVACLDGDIQKLGQLLSGIEPCLGGGWIRESWQF